MKHNQNKYFQGLNRLLGLGLMVGFGFSLTAQAAPVDLATIPLANSPTVSIQPNLLYVLDDSGSMQRDYMPNWVNDNSAEYAAFGNDAAYNALAYNPALRYFPPANFDSGGLNTTQYPSQTGLTTATGADSSAKPNWKKVKRDPYLSTSTDNITSSADYSTTLPGEHCTLADLKVCVVQATPSASHPFPAPIRWCDSVSNASASTPPPGSCQGSRVGSFDNLRAPSMAAAAIATITFTNANSKPRVNGITVNGQEIMDDRTSKTNNEDKLASDAANDINDCTAAAVKDCTISGYSASASGNVLTIFSPTAITTTPVVDITKGTVNLSITAFSLPPAQVGSRVNVSIVSTNNSYPYPGSASKAAERTDCAASTCTYIEEMTNYANWHTYYRTRFLLMKTATSLGFSAVGDSFRVGYMTISPFSNQRLNLDTFATTHKAAWYTKLFATTINGGTPLREALSRAGRIYADKETISGTFTDPIEYECQQNFTLLTTDGGWNSAGGIELDGGSMGNYDGSPALPPYYEGSTAKSDTLADVAKYYRDTDLRTSALGNCTGALGSSVCETASLSPTPPNQKQTMVTLTLGLGVDGELAYTADYKTATAGDFSEIKAGTKNWPDPLPGGEARTDDLWHAAVNGDGTYFSAKRPNELVQQLQEAIASIKIKTGASAAAATSTLNPVAGDNFAFFSGYTSGHWTGNLEKREIDPVTGAISPIALVCVEDIVTSNTCLSPSSIIADGAGGYDCVTPNVLDPTSCPGTLVGTDCKEPVIPSCNGALKLQATRTILFNQGSSLQPFDYASLNASQQATTATSFLQANLTQGPSLSAAQLTNLTGPNLIEYLKGDTSFDEGAINADNRVFRKRQAILGDLIDSEPVFVGDSPLNYSDPGYQAFKTAQAGRAKTVYVGGNDGMLHAFDADTLQERWAYVPTMVIKNLWRLADYNYSAKHANFVNGDPVVADVCVAADCTIATASDWKTILVGGLDGGGRGYYALDITDPLSPALLWEFDAGNSINNDPNLGYSYSNPIITKRAIDGKWTVIFASGYNNIPDNNAFYSLTTTKFKPNNPVQYTTGDGLGRLFIVNAATGVKLSVIVTGSGTVANPSGLAKINAFVDDAAKNNETRYIYGGDLLGNLWRFDIYNDSVIKFATLEASGAQPIATVPELGEIKGKRVVFVGTGKYLEVSDLTDTSLQTLYAIKDDNAVATLVNPRASLVEQTIVPGNPGERVGGAAQPVDFTTGRGWYIDLPDTGERQGIPSQLVLGTLLVPTVVPTSSACQPAGYGWLNFLDYETGAAVVNGGFVSKQTSSPLVGLNVVYIDGKPSVFGTTADGEKYKIDGVPFSSSGTGFQTRRSIWREIIE